MLVELNEKEFEMITVFRRLFMNENEVIEVDYIDHDNYKEHIGKTVKVKRFVDLIGLGLTKIPINFTEVGGNFYCNNNKLTSLEGSPKEVGGYFYCGGNKLTSLVDAPRKVGGSFYCFKNKLSSLEGAPEKVGGNFECWGNKLKSTKGKPESIGGKFRK